MSSTDEEEGGNKGGDESLSGGEGYEDRESHRHGHGHGRGRSKGVSGHERASGNAQKRERGKDTRCADEPRGDRDVSDVDRYAQVGENRLISSSSSRSGRMSFSENTR